jgi:uncharacterized membrane protein YccC
MSFSIAAVGVVAAATVYSAVEARNARRTSRNALKADREIDAFNTAKAEADTQNSVNGKIADAKRRRRAASLLSVDALGSTGALGGPSTALGAGAPAATPKPGSGF